MFHGGENPLQGFCEEFDSLLVQNIMNIRAQEETISKKIFICNQYNTCDSYICPHRFHHERKPTCDNTCQIHGLGTCEYVIVDIIE